MSDPYYADDMVTLYHGDCLDVLAELPDESVHAVVTDPPYGLANTDPAHVVETFTRWVNGERDYLPSGAGFMGKAWDAFVPPVAVWDEAMRVLKPGGHLLAFAGSRTQDLMGLSVRMAGFEIRDSIAWLYAQGFPKSLDVSKAIDRAAGAEREVVGSKLGRPGMAKDGRNQRGGFDSAFGGDGAGALSTDITAPATPDAIRWQGWGTALKPSHEPIIVARKPIRGTVAANVLAHGTGAINVDGCRVGTSDDLNGGAYAKVGGRAESASLHAGSGMNVPGATTGREYAPPPGRWPPNVLLDDTAASELDAQSGETVSRAGGASGRNANPMSWDELNPERPRGGHTDSGGLSRMFPAFRYEPKAGSAERPREGAIAHPTVKPLDLMRWLVRLVTPPDGIVLEPFAGSGTTAEACVIEGFRCIAIEREADYLPLITQRLTKPIQTALDLDGIA